MLVYFILNAIMPSVMVPNTKYVTFGIMTLIVMTIDAVTINVCRETGLLFPM